MGVLSKLSRLVTGNTPAEEAVAALVDCHQSAIVHARQLARHAELAPHNHAANRLGELADEDQRQASRLAEALRAAGQNVPNVPDTPSAGAPNYWARLVQDLESHRRAVRRLRELTTHFAERNPSVSALFEELGRDEMAHCDALRELIARADPQALN
jgi:ribonuclease D